MPKLKDHSKIDRIYSAALKLVLETGYAGLKMSAVAAHAQLATGTLYTYFKNKRDLINCLFRSLKQAKMKEIFKGYDQELSFYDGFKILWYNYLNAGISEPERNIFIDQYQRSDYLDEQSKQMTEAAYRPFYNVLERAKKAQLIKDIPVEVLGAHLMGGANEVAKLYFKQNKNVRPEVIDQCFEMAWQGIRK